MKKEEKVELIEGVNIPTREAKKSVALLFKGATQGQGLEMKDLMLLATLLVSIGSLVASIL